MFSNHSGIKWEISNRRKSEKSTTMWKFSITSKTKINYVEIACDYQYWNIQRVEEENTNNIRKYFGINENKNITYQNSWDAGKAVLRGKCIAVNAYFFWISNSPKKKKSFPHAKTLRINKQLQQGCRIQDEYTKINWISICQQSNTQTWNY